MNPARLIDPNPAKLKTPTPKTTGRRLTLAKGRWSDAKRSVKVGQVGESISKVADTGKFDLA